MNNKDFTYLIIFILIFISSIISQKKRKFPRYSQDPIFNIFMLIFLIVILHKNIYIGIFSVYTYLMFKIRSSNTDK
jgi:uncharacterized membrane protein